MSEAVRIEIAVEASADVGEGPVWDGHAGVLWWVDIAPGRIHRSDIAGGITTTTQLPMMVGAVSPDGSGGCVAATQAGFTRVRADGSTVPIAHMLPEGHRMNDAKCDTVGRFWAGSVTMDQRPGTGALHVLDVDGSTRRVRSGLHLPNGLDWSPDGDRFYLVDTLARSIFVHDADPDAGTIGEPAALVAYDDGGDGHPDGLPDGLAVDAEGDLWIAMWGGGAVEHRTPTGDLLRRIALPVAQPTSCAFGGPDLDTLFVTTARRGLEAPEPVDGCVLALTGLDSRGRGPSACAVAT